MLSIVSQSSPDAYGVVHYIADVIADMNILPPHVSPGSTCLVLETGQKYIMNSVRAWVFYSSGTGTGGGTGGGTGDLTGAMANNIGYDHIDYPNVDAALDVLFDEVFYVEPKITTFTMTPNVEQYEKGQAISRLEFAWSVNKDIVAQSLTGCTIGLTDRKATYTGIVNTNKTFTLSINDGEKSVSSSKTIKFSDKIYWGSAAIPAGGYDSAFILGLDNKRFADNKKGTYSFNVAADEYGMIAYPTSMGTLTSIKINGFDTDLYKETSIQFTNASGYTTSYDIVRTGQKSLGRIDGTVA